MVSMDKKETEKALAAMEEDVKAMVRPDASYIESYVASLTQKDGRVHIEVDLRHGNAIFQPYSGQHDLEPKIFGYVEDVAKYTKLTMPITVDFLIDEESVPLEKTIEDEFRSNCAFELDEKNFSAHKATRRGVRMLAIGVVILAIYVGLVASERNMASVPSWYEILAEVVSIASWVFVWDAVDQIAFTRSDQHKEALRKAQIAHAEVAFIVTKKESQ